MEDYTSNLKTNAEKFKFLFKVFDWAVSRGIRAEYSECPGIVRYYKFRTAEGHLEFAFHEGEKPRFEWSLFKGKRGVYQCVQNVAINRTLEAKKRLADLETQLSNVNFFSPFVRSFVYDSMSNKDDFRE